MNKLKRLIAGVGVLLMFTSPVAAQEGGSQESRNFNPLVGVWQIEKDGQNQVYAVDGSKWVQGELSPTARDNAAVLCGEKGPDFLKNIAVYKAGRQEFREWHTERLIQDDKWERGPGSGNRI
jgi:hypothetical protein